MPLPEIEPVTPCFPACPSNHSAIGAVDDMWIKHLQYLFMLRYYKNSVWYAKGYIENKNKIIVYLQFCDWYHLNTRWLTQKKGIYYVLYVKDISWFMGNESEPRTNKSHEPWSSSRAICLFHAPIHSQWTQIKRHSFLIFIMLPKKTLSIIFREFKIPAVMGT